MKDAIAIFSGGLDSTTLVYDMLERGYTPHCLSFDYGQKHKKELVYAFITCEKLGLRHEVIDLSGITSLIDTSALLDDGIPIPEGHYAADNMAQTVVPNRNMMMLSIAGAVAVAEKAVTIGIGVHAGDHAVYPDCRPEFTELVSQALWVGNEGFHNFGARKGEEDEYGTFWGVLYAPFLQKSKADIAYRALELNVPLHETWSCYKGAAIHCGRCGTCVERLEAIDEATGRHPLQTLQKRGLVVDETEYADTKFWREAVAK